MSGDHKKSTSLPTLTKVLSFTRPNYTPMTPNFVRSDASTSSDSSSASRKSGRFSAKLSPMMLKGLNKGLKAFNTEKRRRSVRPLQSSVNSSITCSDFDLNLGDEGDDAPPMPARMRRNVSVDSDSKPLRPFRRESSASSVQQSASLKSSFEDQASSKSCRDVFSSVNSSITCSDFQDWGGLLGDEFKEPTPPPPSMRRTVSVDSDSKPLRPLRRESQMSTQTDIRQSDYPEPCQRIHSMSLDSLPVFPSRRESAGVDSLSSISRSTAKSFDYQPCAPGRRTSLIGPTAHMQSLRSDSQPCAPNRKTSMSHSVMDICEEGEEEEEEEEEAKRTLEIMSVSSAVA